MVLAETWIDKKKWRKVKERLPEGYMWGRSSQKKE